LSGAIAIFAKTPGLTPAKTRLAASIGSRSAEAFHRLALDVVEETVLAFLASHSSWQACWAVAEAKGAQNPRWSRLGARHTGEGGLGKRMARIYNSLLDEYDRTLLIGTDAPEMTPAHLATAAHALAASPLVLGPAYDGGFWLVGGRKAIPELVWQRPRYGTETARQDFETQLKAAGLPAPHPLPALADIDEVSDLQRLTKRLGRPTPAKAALADWLDSLG